jgi:hypothetical protein
MAISFAPEQRPLPTAASADGTHGDIRENPLIRGREHQEVVLRSRER